jgi:uracil DNA glycosylase
MNTEMEERHAYEERLKRLSREKSKNWNDSLEKRKKMEYEMAKRRFLEEEKRRREIDEQEKKYFDARENMVIQKAKEQLFNGQDAVKSFNSKLLLCDTLKEREYQKEIKSRKKEINNIIERQFFDMNKKKYGRN